MSGRIPHRKCVLLLAIAPTLAMAESLGDDTIKMNRDIAYASDQVGTAIVRETCD